MGSKLSPALKALISAPHARPDIVKAPKNIKSIFLRLKEEATAKSVSTPAWLTLGTATSMTMNSAECLTELYHVASSGKEKHESVQTAEIIREVALKCIGLNGVPRTINCLGAFRASLPSEVAAGLSTQPTRHPTKENIESINARGRGLWDSIYRPFESKLVDKLAEYHPDLPVFILAGEYGQLFSDPEELGHAVRPGVKIGRVLMSIAAVACLRSQTGVGPQVTSHIFGLRKAFEDGSFKAAGELQETIQGTQWLASDEGNVWMLNKIDEIVNAIGEGRGTTFAPGMEKAKL